MTEAYSGDKGRLVDILECQSDDDAAKCDAINVTVVKERLHR